MRGEERWRGEDGTGRPISMNYNPVTQSLAVSSPGREKVYFLAPGGVDGTEFLFFVVIIFFGFLVCIQGCGGGVELFLGFIEWIS